MNTKQQQFILRFCNQLASVIQACEQHESAEIEIGRRHVGVHQIKVKLLAERETGFAAPIGSHGGSNVANQQNSRPDTTQETTASATYIEPNTTKGTQST